MTYSSDAGISSQFPQHWTDTPVLKDEDNQWVNRFNKIIFDKDFLPFWDKFISNNPNAEYEPETDDSNQSNNPPKKVKIKWGEFFEFFWRLYDSKQLENFNGKFFNPRSPKVEDSLASIEQALKLTANKMSEEIGGALDTRLNELNDTAKDINRDTKNSFDSMQTTINSFITQMRALIEELGGNRNRSRY